MLMKKIIWFLAALGGLVLLSGCVSSGVVVSSGYYYYEPIVPIIYPYPYPYPYLNPAYPVFRHRPPAYCPPPVHPRPPMPPRPR